MKDNSRKKVNFSIYDHPNADKESGPGICRSPSEVNNSGSLKTYIL
jgi:hypothetical protein